jgi:hypothetical protein
MYGAGAGRADNGLSKVRFVYATAETEQVEKAYKERRECCQCGGYCTTFRVPLALGIGVDYGVDYGIGYGIK